MFGVVACSLSCALGGILLAAIGTLRAATATCNEITLLARELRGQVPEVSAVVQMSGLELSDALEEISELSGDLTAGVRQTARSLTTAQSGITAGASYVGQQVRTHVVPAVKTKVVPAVRETLRGRADLSDYDKPLAVKAAKTVKTVARGVRTGVAWAKLRGKGGSAAGEGLPDD